jgi:DNA-binding MarR family transcriptional regulator
MSTKRRAPEPRAPEPRDTDRGPLLGALLRRSHQALMIELNRELADAGYRELQILPSHNAVLRPLWDHPEGVRSTELAASARITKQSMGAIVDQLERLGYVERVDDPDDKRAKRVRLTKRGRDIGRAMRAAVRHVEADWARRVGAARLTALRETLTELLGSLEIDA